MSQEQAVATVIIGLISQKNLRKKRQKSKIRMKPSLERRKNLAFMELAELRLEVEYNYKNCLRMISENFEEIFQLIKDDITKENAQMSELIPSRL